MKQTNTQSQASTRGFTIVEILVTVGVLVLIAVGVSTIFSSIAETVNTGKRVAELNRFSAQLERVMRRDFENITRDGFMVVVHQYAPGDEPLSSWDDHDVQLSPADATDENDNGDPGRPRRVDEIMFFARGQYETARRAISPGMIARSSEAAIYYGHGQKRRPDLVRDFSDPVDDTNLFFNPSTRDNNLRHNIGGGQSQAGLGVRSTDSILNPNQYASDWSLLRHVTLLAQPQTSGQDLPDTLYNVERIGDDRQWLEDSDRQVALQPAGRSIYNSLAQSGFDTLPDPTGTFVLPKWFGQKQIQNNGPIALGYTDPALRASGLVDIVTDDLDSIRTILQGVSGSSDVLFDDPTDYWGRSNPSRIITPMDMSYDEFASIFWEDPTTSPSPSDAGNPMHPGGGALGVPLVNARKWMLDALPSIWDWDSGTDDPIQLSRVRYESIPTRLLFAEDAFDGLGGTENQNRLRTYAEANQEMLGSSVFIPRCTEFIVEWSMGYIDRTITDPVDPDYKRMLWYGLPRGIDEDDNGSLEALELHYTSRYQVRNNTGLSAEQAATEKWMSELVMGHDTATEPDIEISMFGYQYKNPDIPDDGSTPGIDESIGDWPWPKFIRITVSIADANDITLERTFQMVFEIPDASNN